MEDCVVFFFFLPLTSLYQQRASAASEAPAGVNISSRGSLPILILPCLKQSPVSPITNFLFCLCNTDHNWKSRRERESQRMRPRIPQKALMFIKLKMRIVSCSCLPTFYVLKYWWAVKQTGKVQCESVMNRFSTPKCGMALRWEDDLLVIVDDHLKLWLACHFSYSIN